MTGHTGYTPWKWAGMMVNHFVKHCCPGFMPKKCRASNTYPFAEERLSSFGAALGIDAGDVLGGVRNALSSRFLGWQKIPLWRKYGGASWLTEIPADRDSIYAPAKRSSNQFF